MNLQIMFSVKGFVQTTVQNKDIQLKMIENINKQLIITFEKL